MRFSSLAMVVSTYMGMRMARAYSNVKKCIAIEIGKIPFDRHFLSTREKKREHEHTRHRFESIYQLPEWNNGNDGVERYPNRD